MRNPIKNNATYSVSGSAASTASVSLLQPSMLVGSGVYRICPLSAAICEPTVMPPTSATPATSPAPTPCEKLLVKNHPFSSSAA